VPVSISVVIPSYNRLETITYCLDSACRQTVEPGEIIVVDDCSTDGTAATVHEYSRAHPSVRLVALDRRCGAQAARNRGIKEARGEWIAFLDSDDEWMPDKLERQIAALGQVGLDPLTVVHTDCFIRDEATGDSILWNLGRCEGWVHSALLRTPGVGPFFSSLVTSKAACVRIGLLDEAVPSFQEWDTAIRLATACRFVHLREPLFVYHLHRGEMISKDTSKDVEGYQYVVDKHRADILRLCGVRAFNRHLARNALKALRGGQLQEARRIVRRAAGSPLALGWELVGAVVDRVRRRVATRLGTVPR
jgi:glycosyltransferase involved in cell wall biosynthesis